MSDQLPWRPVSCCLADAAAEEDRRFQLPREFRKTKSVQVKLGCWWVSPPPLDRHGSLEIWFFLLLVVCEDEGEEEQEDCGCGWRCADGGGN